MGMLTDRGLTQSQQTDVVDYLFDNATKLRELTLRMVIKLANIYISNPSRWREIAKVTLHKGT
jgi:hypothetical protein